MHHKQVDHRCMEQAGCTVKVVIGLPLIPNDIQLTELFTDSAKPWACCFTCLCIPCAQTGKGDVIARIQTKQIGILLIFSIFACIISTYNHCRTEQLAAWAVAFSVPCWPGTQHWGAFAPAHKTLRKWTPSCNCSASCSTKTGPQDLELRQIPDRSALYLTRVLLLLSITECTCGQHDGFCRKQNGGMGKGGPAGFLNKKPWQVDWVSVKGCFMTVST
jgi:hypothetical protein